MRAGMMEQGVYRERNRDEKKSRNVSKTELEILLTLNCEFKKNGEK